MVHNIWIIFIPFLISMFKSQLVFITAIYYTYVYLYIVPPSSTSTKRSNNPKTLTTVVAMLRRIKNSVCTAIILPMKTLDVKKKQLATCRSFCCVEVAEADLFFGPRNENLKLKSKPIPTVDVWWVGKMKCFSPK